MTTPDTTHDDELRRLWRSDQPPAPPAQEVLMHVKTRSYALDRSLFWRDVREAAAMVLVLAIAVWVAALASGWLPWLGVACLAVASAFVWRGLRAGRGEVRRDVDTARWLDGELARVEAEIGKLRTVARWYVLPLALGGTLWAVSLVPAIGLPLEVALTAAVVTVVASAAIFAVVGWAVHALNRRAVERGLEPYRDELLALRRELASATAGA